MTTQDNKCYYCAHVLDLKTGDTKLSQFSIDRLNNNLGHLIGNCVISCLFCNHAKNDTDEQNYIDFIKVLKEGKMDNKLLHKIDYFNEHPNLIKNMRSRAHHSDKNKTNDMNVISTAEIKELIEKQNNCCAITGIQFINAHVHKFPFKMSLDRIVSGDELHTKDNCQLVCMAIQFGKSNKSNEEVIKYIEEIRNSN